MIQLFCKYHCIYILSWELRSGWRGGSRDITIVCTSWARACTTGGAGTTWYARKHRQHQDPHRTTTTLLHVVHCSGGGVHMWQCSLIMRHSWNSTEKQMYTITTHWTPCTVCVIITTLSVHDCSGAGLLRRTRDLPWSPNSGVQPSYRNSFRLHATVTSLPTSATSVSWPRRCLYTAQEIALDTVFLCVRM